MWLMYLSCVQALGSYAIYTVPSGGVLRDLPCLTLAPKEVVAAGAVDPESIAVDLE